MKRSKLKSRERDTRSFDSFYFCRVPREMSIIANEILDLIDVRRVVRYNIGIIS